MKHFLHLVCSDITTGQILCGLGDGTRDLALYIKDKYGVGVHKNARLKRHDIQIAFVLDSCPINYPIKALKNAPKYLPKLLNTDIEGLNFHFINSRMQKIFEKKVRPNIHPTLGDKLDTLWEDIARNVSDLYNRYYYGEQLRNLGVQVTTVFMIYNKLQTQVFDGAKFVPLKPNKQTNLYCWYNFVTLVPSFGGIHV